MCRDNKGELGSTASEEEGQAEEEEQEQHEAEHWTADKAEERVVVVVVGTGVERGNRSRGVGNPCKGRFLLIQIMSNQTGIFAVLG